MIQSVIKKGSIMKDIEMSRLFGIPVNTIQDFKKSAPSNWRNQVYNFLSSFDYEKAKTRIENINSLKS